MNRVPGIVVVGASTGGLRAISTLLSGLPPAFPRPVAIVLHRATGAESALIDLLGATAKIPVREAEDKDPIDPATVYLAPADYHLLVDEEFFSLTTDAPVAHSRPSIDALFESAADAFGARVIAIVLTGANGDGARGAMRVKACGGIVIATDPGSAESPAMPLAAIRTGVVDHVLPLEQIAPMLCELLS